MNVKKIKNFILYFISHFVLLLFLILFIGDSIFKTSWELFNVKNAQLFLYLFIFAFIQSTFFFLYLNIHERRKYKKVEDALKMLNEGQYSADVFLKMFSDKTPVQVNKQIDREFLRLQERMILISEEAISSAQQALTISKETREEIVEVERKRIARELHDSVSQQLFAAAMLLSTIQTEDDIMTETASKQIHLIHSIIEEAQSEMRALLLHLRPVKLEGKSLKKGIEDLLDELASKVPIKIKHEIEDIHLSEVVENHLFRIIQELLSNVLRHSGAKELELYFKKTEDFYRLRFVDDGIGFNMEEKKNSGLGLLNMRERIERFGGNVQVISFPQQGTSVEVRIPLITGRTV